MYLIFSDKPYSTSSLHAYIILVKLKMTTPSITTFFTKGASKRLTLSELSSTANASAQPYMTFAFYLFSIELEVSVPLQLHVYIQQYCNIIYEQNNIIILSKYKFVLMYQECNDTLFPQAMRIAIFDMYYDTFYWKLTIP